MWLCRVTHTQPCLLSPGSLLSWVRVCEEVITREAATSVLLCCDGSATIGPNGCTDASAGLVLLPFRGDVPLTGTNVVQVCQAYMPPFTACHGGRIVMD
jgi:hypothetical protein